MNKYIKRQCQVIAKEMVEVLKEKSYDAFYAEDLEEAKKLVLNMIPYKSSVAVGGSETLAAMGIVDIFRQGDYDFFDRYQNIPFTETVEIYRQSMLADFLVTSTNALTRKGELVNTDSSGNRVAGMIFGPKRVIVVAGANKVVDNLDEALKRIRKIAPMNAFRNGHKVPCVETGICVDCQLQQSVCNSIGIINHGRKFEGRITVIMVAEEAGF
jgi:hypothetical protein